jgi:hypothetical protein
MPEVILGRGAAAGHFDRFPVTLEQKSSRASDALRLLLLPPVVAAMLAPAVLVAASAAPALSSAADNPVAAAEAVVGIALWMALLLVPAKRLLQRFGSARSVRIDRGMVTVHERSLLRSRSWQRPLSDFTGIAHLARSSVSGVRHELHLVHAERGKSLLIHTADSISQATIDGAGALLGLPLMPALRLYRFGARKPAAAPTLGTSLAA